jgi:hypothetical protein
MIEDGVLGGHQDFPVASETNALDQKMEDTLASLSLDVEGRLVQSLSLQGVWGGFDMKYWKFEFLVRRHFQVL